MGRVLFIVRVLSCITEGRRNSRNARKMSDNGVKRVASSRNEVINYSVKNGGYRWQPNNCFFHVRLYKISEFFSPTMVKFISSRTSACHECCFGKKHALSLSLSLASLSSLKNAVILSDIKTRYFSDLSSTRKVWSSNKRNFPKFK